MSRIISKLFGLLQAAELFDAMPHGDPKSKKRKKRGNVEGDKFYKGLSYKRRNGKWRVKQ